ncbi:MAG TPA: hypothetical protein VH255_00935 [Verrucomicrobiae bacterium]|nr:hypothetical protein [Verrucomicrobiae bacterium]
MTVVVMVIVMMVIVRVMAVVIMHVVGMVVMERYGVSMRIVTIHFVMDGMGAPIGMASFPIMETAQTNGIEREPDVIGSQIEI